MKRLVIGSSILLDPHFRIMYDEAETAYLKNEEVVFAACGGGCKACVANPHAGRVQCAGCNLLGRWFERRFRGRIKVVHFPKVPPHQGAFDYADVKQLKNVVYKGVNIGYAAFSEFVTLTRDLLEDLTDEKRRYMDFLLAESCRYVDVAIRLLDEHSPDAVSVFNGRMFETRPFFELARLRGIPVRVNEVVSDHPDQDTVEFRHFSFENCFPQDVDGYAAKVRKCWEKSSRAAEEKEQIAADFFKKRRGGFAAGDAVTPGHDGVFIQKQVRGTLPEGFDSSKRNIVIFNSSEDELCSIDKAFESHALFLSHIEGIETVARILSEHADYHVYLRVHPNLQKIKQPYHLKLYDLPKRYPNLTVIPADSKCSTYDLMDAAEKVVVLGSTTGVESTYWRRPVILIGSAMYYQLDIAYKPRSIQELSRLLLTDDLPPRPVDDALKYAYYLLRNVEISEKSRVIDLRVVRRRLYGEYRWVPAWPHIPMLNFLLYSPVSNCVRQILKVLARNVLPS